MIDLHTHTTASDGRCSPAELVARAAAAGVGVLSVTDHDTVAGCEPTAAACAAAQLEFVPGIEITAVRDGVDVHVLGYFMDVESPALAQFLALQREDRISRVRAMVDLLRGFGMELDAEAILKPAREDAAKSAGRPWVARAMVEAGYVPTISDAFERWLGHGRPAFVPRRGTTPQAVIAQLREAGGIASIAHPGLLEHDEWLPTFVDAGLDAIEAYHSEHDATTTSRYVSFADKAGIAVTGGSDYHGDASHGALGDVTLPRDAFERIKALAATRRSG
ncbi:MAG: PHP domain-containing protein [Acidobacteriota bacterium]